MKISKDAQNRIIATVTIILILSFPFMFRCLKNMKFCETTEICIASLYIISCQMVYPLPFYMNCYQTHFKLISNGIGLYYSLWLFFRLLVSTV